MKRKYSGITIAVDFDGVIHQYSKGWHDGTIYDPPVPGAAQALRQLRKAGCIIVIHSCRNQDDEMRRYLHKHKIPFDRMHYELGKPIADLYIDDRALRFTGNWEETLAQAKHIIAPPAHYEEQACMKRAATALQTALQEIQEIHAKTSNPALEELMLHAIEQTADTYRQLSRLAAQEQQTRQ